MLTTVAVLMEVAWAAATVLAAAAGMVAVFRSRFPPPPPLSSPPCPHGRARRSHAGGNDGQATGTQGDRRPGDTEHETQTSVDKLATLDGEGRRKAPGARSAKKKVGPTDAPKQMKNTSCDIAHVSCPVDMSSNGFTDTHGSVMLGHLLAINKYAPTHLGYLSTALVFGRWSATSIT